MRIVFPFKSGSDLWVWRERKRERERREREREREGERMRYGDERVSGAGSHP